MSKLSKFSNDKLDEDLQILFDQIDFSKDVEPERYVFAQIALSELYFHL